ncbi:MAG: hypothetical protein KDA31_05900 [Phycisphaerales bacterium]|nr:hypothetical protein [Phycisphaerales bacterium]MCB9837513.1 hypothetical protein [Phycisphaera sp.]
MSEQAIVLKFGGSVLRSRESLASVAAEIERFNAKGLRVIAVVSALEGTTDELLSQARSVQDEPEESALALLLATGEFTSAALLSLTLASRGVRAPVLGPHAIGLRTKGAGADTNPASVDAWTLTRALDASRVVVVPGFVGVGPSREHTLLGRGGSDLSALFIASQLGARCRLVKDVAGLYERDPASPGPTPRRYRTLSWGDALALDGRIVQHKAVRFAQRERLAFEVGAFGRDDASHVGATGATWHADEPEVACA